MPGRGQAPSRGFDDFAAIDRHVAGQMRKHRVAAGLSQAEVGRYLGVSFQQVQKYESGANRISAGKLFQLARICRVDVRLFFPAQTGASSDVV